jgi:putative ABC transport system permease protein
VVVVISTLWRASLRHVERHPWQIGLSILGIALGVAVTLAVDVANESARRAFDLATEAVTGRATHQISAGPSGLDERLYRELRIGLGLRSVAPVVATDLAAPAYPGRVFHLLGIDPLAEAPLRPYLAGAGATASREGEPPSLTLLAELMGRPGTALIAAPTARALGVARGDTLTVRAGAGRRALRIAGFVEPGDPLSARALADVLVTDISTAQELLGLRGRLSRIDLVVDDGPAGGAILERVRRLVPPGAQLTPAGARSQGAAQMARAFSLNLRALSLLALLVGMFLIYNTMTFSVVERRTLIGTLRALGVTRGEVFALILVEAFAIGAVGTAAGIALGLGLARALLGLVTRTINDLFFVVSVTDVWISPSAIAGRAVLGVGATLVAALAPALEATGAPPRAVLSRGQLEASTRRAAPRLALSGVGLGLVGGILLGWPRGGIALGFAGLFTLILACALITPLGAIAIAELFASIAGRAFGAVGRMAARGIIRSLSRTAIAIAALMVAVSTTIGVGLMISSFRDAVVRWLEGTLRQDVYVSPPSLIGSRSDSTLDAAAIERLAQTPGVAGTSTTRTAVVPGPRGPVNLVVLGLGRDRRPDFRFRDGDPARAWPDFDAGAVLVTEPFAYRQRIGRGDRIALESDRGRVTFPVAGVVYDYGSAVGAVVMARATYERDWDDRGISGLALSAAPGVSVDALMDDLRASAGAGHELTIRSNRGLRDASLVIFDRTFAITGVLRTLSVVVAFIGVLSALMALQLERGREIGVLRALGLTPRQVWAMVTAQTGLMGAIAGLLALPVGLLLASVLIFVINRRSFGWTMPLDVPLVVLGQGLLLAVVAGLLAGLYPAWMMSRASPSEALRDE